jgi:hypothetical protein
MRVPTHFDPRVPTHRRVNQEGVPQQSSNPVGADLPHVKPGVVGVVENAQAGQVSGSGGGEKWKQEHVIERRSDDSSLVEIVLAGKKRS